MKRFCTMLILAAMLLSMMPTEAAASRTRRGRDQGRTRDTEGVFGPSVAVRWGAPLGLSGSMTILIGELPMMEDLPMGRGALVGLEAGQGGAKLSVGHTVWYHVMGWFPYGAIFGQALKATLVRTWGDPREVAPDATYLGGEAEQGIFFFNLNLGYGVKVGGAADSPDGIVTWSLGVGF